MISTMRGTVAVPFSELFGSTVEAHGWLWAYLYYTKHGMQDWEFWFWFFRDSKLA